MWIVRALLLVVGLAALAAPGMPAHPSVALAAAAPGGQDALHQVLPGDNLHLIAGYYYGDARHWDRIWQANRDQVSDPNRIAEGMLLRIPDVRVPEESYADFLARVRPPPAPPEAPAITPPAPAAKKEGEAEAPPAGPPAPSR